MQNIMGENVDWGPVMLRHESVYSYSYSSLIKCCWSLSWRKWVVVAKCDGYSSMSTLITWTSCMKMNNCCFFTICCLSLSHNISFLEATASVSCLSVLHWKICLGMGHHEATEKEIKQIREEEEIDFAVLSLFVFRLSFRVHFNQHGIGHYNIKGESGTSRCCDVMIFCCLVQQICAASVLLFSCWLNG